MWWWALSCTFEAMTPLMTSLPSASTVLKTSLSLRPYVRRECFHLRSFLNTNVLAGIGILTVGVVSDAICPRIRAESADNVVSTCFKLTELSRPGRACPCVSGPATVCVERGAISRGEYNSDPLAQRGRQSGLNKDMLNEGRRPKNRWAPTPGPAFVRCSRCARDRKCCPPPCLRSPTAPLTRLWPTLANPFWANPFFAKTCLCCCWCCGCCCCGCGWCWSPNAGPPQFRCVSLSEGRDPQMCTFSSRVVRRSQSRRAHRNE